LVTLTSLDNTLQGQVQKLVALDANTLGLEDKYSSLSVNLTSVSARLSNLENSALSGNDLPIANSPEATISGTLTVLGKTTLADLGVTGHLTIGVLSIEGLSSPTDPNSPPETADGASLSTLSGPLRLQANALGDVEIMGGKVTIDTSGNLKVEGTVTTKIIAAEEYQVLGDKTAGRVEIPAGQISVTIEIPALSDNSLIFITPDEPATVSAKKTASTSAEIRLKDVAPAPVNVSWWVIN
jgi:hypothetical protein